MLHAPLLLSMKRVTRAVHPGFTSRGWKSSVPGLLSINRVLVLPVEVNGSHTLIDPRGWP